MRFKRDSLRISPSTNYLNPTLILNGSCNVHNPNFIMVLRFSGKIEIENIVIARLKSVVNDYNNNEEKRMSLVKDSNKVRSLSFNLEAELSEKALLLIENNREKNKGNVNFNITLEAIYLESELSLLNPGKINKRQIQEVNFNLLELSKGNSFFTKKAESCKLSERIPSSDWVDRYLSELTKEEFIIYSIPKEFNNISVKSTFKKRIEEAINSISDMEKARNTGDWNGVIKESRPVIELMKNKREIEKLLLDSKINQQATTDFLNLIQSFFNYASKFVHKVGRGKNAQIMNNIIAQREDAEFVYSLALNIINVIASKVHRQYKE